MATRKPVASWIYQLHVELEDVVPPVWRQIIVPGTMKLPDLHNLLQLVMGWTDSHLHSFEIGKKTYTNAHEDLDELRMLPEAKEVLGDLLGTTIQHFVYEYDFGDSWRHRITVESVSPPHPDRDYPLCVAGMGAAPPEDVGGAPGYEEFLEAIENPAHSEHESMLTWVGGAFDPEGFDLNTINRTLRIGPHPADREA